MLIPRQASRWLRAALAIAVLAGATVAQAQPEATRELRFGMSAPMSGPAADLGIDMRVGIEAAFAEANRRGGVRSMKLRLITLDDCYEPLRTAPNMRRLIDQDQVLAIVGNVGTPTAVVALPIAASREVPFFGAYTGADLLRRTPPDRGVINFRASYAEEITAMVDGLVDRAGLRADEIAFFTQRDAYGDAGYNAGVTALRRHGLDDLRCVAHGRYERNTLAVENGLADILQRPQLPRAVILVGAYAPCAAFIRLALKSGLDAVFLNVSFVGAASLAQSLGDSKARVLVTQVVPDFGSSLPLAQDFRRALQALPDTPAPTYGSFEGYCAGRTLWLDRDHHQASHGVWPTIVRHQEVVPFAWRELPDLVQETAAR